MPSGTLSLALFQESVSIYKSNYQIYSLYLSKQANIQHTKWPIMAFSPTPPAPYENNATRDTNITEEKKKEKGTTTAGFTLD
jgi:hypothetical protein